MFRLHSSTGEKRLRISCVDSLLSARKCASIFLCFQRDFLQLSQHVLWSRVSRVVLIVIAAERNVNSGLNVKKLSSLAFRS